MRKSLLGRPLTFYWIWASNVRLPDKELAVEENLTPLGRLLLLLRPPFSLLPPPPESITLRRRRQKSNLITSWNWIEFNFYEISTSTFIFICISLFILILILSCRVVSSGVVPCESLSLSRRQSHRHSLANHWPLTTTQFRTCHIISTLDDHWHVHRAAEQQPTIFSSSSST